MPSPSTPLCSQIHGPCEAKGVCFLEVFVNSLFMALLFWRHVANGTCWQEVKEQVYLVGCNFLGKQSVCNHLPPFYPVLPAGHPEARTNFILEKWWQVLSVTSGTCQAGYYQTELTFHTQKCSLRESKRQSHEGAMFGFLTTSKVSPANLPYKRSIRAGIGAGTHGFDANNNTRMEWLRKGVSRFSLYIHSQTPALMGQGPDDSHYYSFTRPATKNTPYPCSI